IDMPGRPDDARALIVTLEGVVNRKQPRIYAHEGGDSENLWLTELAVPTSHVDDPLALVSKYKADVAGIVITDPNQPDTLNLATTIAGQPDAVVASPALAATLVAPPFNLATIADLREQHFASKLAVYQYELDHYAAGATHRMIVGLTP